jgi:uncharacterized protein (TIGR03086 family)
MRNDGGMSSSDVDLAEAVLDETEAIIAAVRPEQLHGSTPCSDYDVADIINHLVGWARSFAARFTGVAATEDPNEYRTGAHPAVEFHKAAETIVGAYRTAAEPTNQLPAGFIVMEFLTHGWDLAAATNRSANFPADAAELGLETARGMLKPEYRGSAFLPEFEVLPTAGAVDRLVAFMGRNPGWQQTA